ncbi:MAG: hypothetical protein KDK30_12835 [Leptospiraceae bacterium]|nr:hypothetical protein [Leptospiraceae bacterium]
MRFASQIFGMFSGLQPVRVLAFLLMGMLGLMTLPDALPGQSDGAGNFPLDRLVRLRVIKNHYSVAEPWKGPVIKETYASGFVLSDGRILTDLENVRYAASVQVEFTDREGIFSARIEHQGFDCGLAQLSVKENILETDAGSSDQTQADESRATETRDDTESSTTGESNTNNSSENNAETTEAEKDEPIGEDTREEVTESELPSFYEYAPSMRGDVAVIGIVNNRVIIRRSAVRSVGRGSIDNSDIDRLPLLWPRVSTDRIPEALSGGPVMQNGKIIGVYHHNDNEPYVVTAGVVRTFLNDIKDGRYDGFPHTGFAYESLENRAHRSYLKLQTFQSGVYIRHVDFGSPAARVMRVGDVLLGVDSLDVGFDGRLRKDGRQFAANVEEYLNIRRSPVQLKVFRNGRVLEEQLDARVYTGHNMFRAGLNDVRPYFLSAGLVFQELNYDVRHHSSAGEQSLVRYHYENPDFEAVDRYVVLTARLPDRINYGSEDFLYGIVESINGRRVRNLRDFAVEWLQTRDEFLVIRFVEQARPLVLPFHEVERADERVDRQYSPQENGRVR